MDCAALLLRQTAQAKKPQSSSSALKIGANDPTAGGEEFSAALEAVARKQSSEGSHKPSHGSHKQSSYTPPQRAVASDTDAKPAADPQAASVPQSAADSSQCACAAPQALSAQPAAQTAEQSPDPTASVGSNPQSPSVAPPAAGAPQPTDQAAAQSAESVPDATDSGGAQVQTADAASAPQPAGEPDTQPAESSADAKDFNDEEAQRANVVAAAADALQPTNETGAQTRNVAASASSGEPVLAPQNSNLAAAAPAAQATEQAVPDTSNPSRAKQTAIVPSMTEASAQSARASDGVASPNAPADPAPNSETRAEEIASPNQARPIVASALPEQAGQNGKPASTDSSRAETPDVSLGGDMVQSAVKAIASTVERAAARTLSAASNDATAAPHKPARAATAGAQGQSLAAADASSAAGLSAAQEKAAPAQTGALAAPKNFLENVVRQARLLTRPDGASELTLKLHPSELGAVVVRLTLKNGHLDGHLQVDSQSARASLESVLPRVKQALAGEGIDLDRLDVAVRGDGSSRQSAQDSARSRQAFQAAGGLSGDGTAFESRIGAPAASAGRSAVAAGIMDFIV
jgi:flagellar hook-length control protein FliK